MALTRSPNAALLDGPAPPRRLITQSARANSWEDVADLAESLGVPLDTWQEQVFEAAMGERSNGRWVSKYVGISTPRQNGKSQLIVARALAGVLLFGEKKIIISAHETDTAREIWKRMTDVIEDNPTLEARVTHRMDAIGRESLSFGDGLDRQEIQLKARGLKGTRGFSADCLLLDEAQILGKAAWGSINPTASARPNPQLWLFGTPPTLTDDPFAFTRIRENGLAKKARHCWAEWAAEPGDDFDDPATWAKANPSFGVRISEEACADDRAAMDDDQFAMERLGMWRSELQRISVFGPDAWESVEKIERPEGLEPGAIGVAVSIDLENASIVAAAEIGDAESLVRPLRHGPAPDRWLVTAIAELYEKFKVPVIIDGKGPAADFIPELQEALGDGLHVAVTSEVLDACSSIYKTVRGGLLVHACDGADDELDTAVMAAVKRDVGDRWAWGRKKSGNDISPLEAATLGLWGLTSEKAKPFESAYAETGFMWV